MNCPLCESTNLKMFEMIKKDDLIHLYYKLTKYNFDYLITNDFECFECLKCGLKFFYPLLTFDDKFYTILQQFDWYYMENKEEYEYARNFINHNDKVLEVGCGKGAFAKYINTKDYVGLELSESALKLANEKGIKVVKETIQNFAMSHKEEFDVVVSFQVLEHVSNPRSFIESKLNTLKPGGRMIIGVPCEDSFLKYSVNGILNMPPHHLTRWSKRTLVFIAKKYNLIIEDIYHEKVQEVHKVWFLATFIRSLFLQSKLIDRSIKGRIASKISNFLASLAVKNLKDEFLPGGHTMVGVFRKQ